uniref:Transposon Ty3-I Gag-Pol polyprotein n=1 Tax=Cajanus cajan TaxID=3821 RepID=A0A151UDM0_CAJCA
MILKAQYHHSSLDEATSSSSSTEDEAIDSEEEILPSERDLLLVRRLISNQSSEIDQSQREKLFHTRCKVLEKTCSLIVYSGSTSNCCSTRLVDKLALTTKPHPKPYKMQWINKERGIVVSQQARIPISIGKYKEEVLCDIVPLEASHVLLGRPWQFDKKTIHDGLTNKISFQHLGKKFVWFPLSPSQVNEDQLKLKAKKDEDEKRKNKNKKKRKEKSFSFGEKEGLGSREP